MLKELDVEDHVSLRPDYREAVILEGHTRFSRVHYMYSYLFPSCSRCSLLSRTSRMHTPYVHCHISDQTVVISIEYKISARA